MKILYPNLKNFDIRCDRKDNTKRAMQLHFHCEKQNGGVKRNENNMKDVIEISIAYWHVHLR